jgi:hypothetical protein
VFLNKLNIKNCFAIRNWIFLNVKENKNHISKHEKQFYFFFNNLYSFFHSDLSDLFSDLSFGNLTPFLPFLSLLLLDYFLSFKISFEFASCL